MPYPPTGNIPNRGIEPSSPALQVDSLPTEPLGKSGGSLHRSPLFCTAQSIASSFQITCHLLLYITIFISGSKSKIRIKEHVLNAYYMPSTMLRFNILILLSGYALPCLVEQNNLKLTIRKNYSLNHQISSVTHSINAVTVMMEI